MLLLRTLAVFRCLSVSATSIQPICALACLIGFTTSASAQSPAIGLEVAVGYYILERSGDSDQDLEPGWGLDAIIDLTWPRGWSIGVGLGISDFEGQGERRQLESTVYLSTSNDIRLLTIFVQPVYPIAPSAWIHVFVGGRVGLAYQTQHVVFPAQGDGASVTEELNESGLELSGLIGLNVRATSAVELTTSLIAGFFPFASRAGIRGGVRIYFS